MADERPFPADEFEEHLDAAIKALMERLGIGRQEWHAFKRRIQEWLEEKDEGPLSPDRAAE